MSRSTFVVFVVMALVFFSTFAIFPDAKMYYSKPSVFDMHSPCHEDEVLYPIVDGKLAFPEGKLACVNLEEFE